MPGRSVDRRAFDAARHLGRRVALQFAAARVAQLACDARVRAEFDSARGRHHIAADRSVDEHASARRLHIALHCAVDAQLAAGDAHIARDHGFGADLDTAAADARVATHGPRERHLSAAAIERVAHRATDAHVAAGDDGVAVHRDIDVDLAAGGDQIAGDWLHDADRAAGNEVVGTLVEHGDGSTGPLNDRLGLSGAAERQRRREDSQENASEHRVFSPRA